MAGTVQQFRGDCLTPPFEQAKVSDVMHPGVIGAPPHWSLRLVARAMAAHRVHCVVVAGLDPDDHLVWGLVSDMDVVRAAHDTGVTTAGDVARTEPICVDSQATLAEAADMMAAEGAPHLVVVENGRPVGILSSLDVTRSLASPAA